MITRRICCLSQSVSKASSEFQWISASTDEQLYLPVEGLRAKKKREKKPSAAQHKTVAQRYCVNTYRTPTCVCVCVSFACWSHKQQTTMDEHRDSMRWKTTCTRIRRRVGGGEVGSKLAVLLTKASRAVFFAFWIETCAEEGGALTKLNNNASPTEVVLVRERGVVLVGTASTNPGWVEACHGGTSAHTS